MRDHMDPVFGNALEQVFDDLAPTSERVAPAQAGPNTRERRRQTVFVTAAVGVVVVVAAALTIQAVHSKVSPAVKPLPAASSVSNLELKAELPNQPYGRVLQTWTDQAPSDPTGTFEATGSTVVIAAVCSGGGAISIQAPGRPAHQISCNKLTVQQPYWKFNLGGDDKPTTATAPFRAAVSVTSGSPRYIVRMWAVDPRILTAAAGEWKITTTSATVPTTLRSCTSGDLATTGSIDRLPNYQGDVVTVTNTSASDCAIRSWPALTYLDTHGNQIGPAAGQGLDSTIANANKYGEVPPVRLAAGGHGYLIAGLFTKSRLTSDDTVTKKEPLQPGETTRSLCDPVTVHTLLLVIAGTTIKVPVPQTPTTAACRSGNGAFTVTPLAAHKPTRG